MSATFPHGECECRGGCQCEVQAGPAAYEVTRDGKVMRVCTRCDLLEDAPTKRLLVTRNDDAQAYYDWDVLGLVCIAGALSDQETVESSAEVPS